MADVDVHGTGLVLEGGATRGVFTSGVLDYLMEQGLYLPYVVGTSAGACNAVDYVSRQIGRTRDCMIPHGKEHSYLSLQHTLKTHSLFDMDMVFDRYPNEIFPFDYETYFHSPLRCEIVVTDCLTGRAEYLDERSDKKRLMDICRASCSVPLASPMVNVDGTPYLDGGIADSIPIIRSLKLGYRKNLVVLTRNAGYHKTPIRKSRPLYVARYKKYPQLVRAALRRAYIYNKTLSYIEKWEAQGRIFVIRPTQKPVSRTEQDTKALEGFYQHGYDLMKENYGRLLRYLEK